MAKQHKKALKAHKLHQLIVGISVIVVAVILAVVLVVTIIPKVTNDARLHRINDIYASLNIGDTYIIQRNNVFGEKRLYDYDKSRSYSSEKDFTRGAPVDVTTKELDTAIKAAGFKFIDEPYAGSAYIQYHYKSSKGEYIRLTVSSKLRDDAFQNSFLMTGKFSDEDFKIDPNAGPSNVVIKVNLDDNNE